MDRVSALLAGRGKRMIGWDEILEGRPRRDTLVMSWRGYLGGIEAAKAGHEVVMSPQTKACYLDHKHLDWLEEEAIFTVKGDGALSASIWGSWWHRWGSCGSRGAHGALGA